MEKNAISMLLIEDQPEQSNQIKRTFENVKLVNKLDTLTVADALNSNDLNPDLILIDLHISAKEIKLIIDKLISKNNFKNSGVIICTENDIDEEIMRLDGVQGFFLRRPFDIQKLMEIIFNKLNYKTVLVK